MRALFGVMVAVGLLLLLISRSCGSSTPPASSRTVAPVPPPEYPRSGEGFLTKDVGIKAYIDPLRATTRTTGRIRYVFVKDPTVTFDDLPGKVERDRKRDKAWRDMLAGEYMVYSLEDRRIWYKWWH
ncbi:hypothetical protein A3A95_00820 [Candidatus Nomurabacteria bacterium RIFCSPLOWO2_01_FULL_39_18]|uniref:Uncharacterized protein n=1 Tax=Candidatus Nomurabacteria bacterium RIFCSPHIGHO2_01_FULL_40_24b TaxID=1801739 RepID=A0A1F6V725_9BACT|nr:MAG: hypothetical protein A2647_02620 [Candidatus Nomurabacteria bacterium RIFCSPHIGHO2_01_FULL_40_24b]OGI89854.1 MAG: hypothetical protein A3A95_00820 [Candidatus Nomurabacteria bacterium RIFCSPLOWO2_01_FULL_39_18]